MKKNTYKIMVLILILFTHIQAQDIDLKKQPGYIDLTQIQIPQYAGKITNITLGPSLLSIAKQNVNGDEELSKMLSGIFSIQVKSFEIDSMIEHEIRPKIKEIEDKLNKEDWQNLIQVIDNDEYTNVSLKYDKEKLVGLLVMSLEDDEVSFVNIVGTINLEQLGNLGNGIGLPDSVFENLEESFDK